MINIQWQKNKKWQKFTYAVFSNDVSYIKYPTSSCSNKVIFTSAKISYI